MASVIDICNDALAEAQQGSISSLTENSNEARACNRSYERVVRGLLRAHPWAFAKKIEALALLSDGDEPDYQFAYQKPSDCLRIRHIFNPAKIDDDTIKFDVRGQMVVTDYEDAKLVYTRYVDDPTEFDEGFLDCLRYRLAMIICVPLGSANLLGSLGTLFRTHWVDATGTDASEQRTEKELGMDFVNART